MPMLYELLIVLVLVLINGFFAGAEIAVVTVRRTRLRELVSRGESAARVLERLRSNPERFLSTVQIGVTVVGASAAAFGGATFAMDLVPVVERVPVLEPYARQIALGAVVVLVSYFSIVLGELVPKSLALRAPERFALIVARPLSGLAWLARPAVWLLTASSNLVLRLFGDHTSFTETRMTADELRALVDEAASAGTVPQESGEIASRALEFSELTAADVMIHRRFIQALSIDAPDEEVRAVMLSSGHQRMPVLEGSIDNIVGYLAGRDLLPVAWEGRPLELRSLLRPCRFVPETIAAGELLQQMRAERLHMVIAVDEHGGTAGLVTLEDLVEELVGEITSEHSPHKALVEREPDGGAVVSGTLPIRDAARELQLELPEPAGITSVGGLCIELAEGRIPAAGESFQTPEGVVLEILDSSARRVRRVRIRPQAASGEGVGE